MSTDTAKAVVTLRSLTAKFDNAVRGASPFYPNICTIQPSDGLDEEYAMPGNVPGMREWLGERLLKELRAAKFTITNKLYESSLRIARHDIDDDRLGLYAGTMEQLGLEAAHHPDELVMDLVVAGDATACWDGQYFFDTDHSWGDSGSQSNDLTYAAATGTTPTVAEFKGSYNQARTAMLKFVNDQGKKLVRPTVTGMDDFLILVPPDLEVVAQEMVQSVSISSGTSNVVLSKPRVVCSPLLTDATEWYLFFLGGALKPFVFQPREPLRRQMKNADDIEDKDVKFLTEARYSAGYLAWWNGVLTTFT